MFGSTTILVGDCRETLRQFPDQSMHACVTSPPYWGLRDYKAGENMIGLEATPEEHIENLLAVFREVRRVLRDDGTLWVNYGDCFEAGGQLQMLPHRVAMALQADGWMVRSAIVWAKGVSFCDAYSGSVMPESVNGTRWERCRVKVEAGKSPARNRRPELRRVDNGEVELPTTASTFPEGAKYDDCPGCDKCNANGGYVLRRGSWRPTSGYELIFMCAKQSGYYCDAEAVRETMHEVRGRQADFGLLPEKKSESERVVRAVMQGVFDCSGDGGVQAVQLSEEGPNRDAVLSGGRNIRNVWTINPAPFAEAHFATYPPALIEPIVKVATPERGVCPECGAPWARVVDTEFRWRPTCGCVVTEPDFRPHVGWAKTYTHNHRPIPAIILDPFGGSGTTGLVANQLGRDAVICELNEDYAKMAKRRIGKALKPHTYRDEATEQDDASDTLWTA